MQILIKALNGKQFNVDIDPEKTVQDLKEQILKNEGSDYKVENQKLIYEGKILADANKLTEYKIDAKKFVVLLITRPPPPPKKIEESKPVATVTKKDDTSKSDKNSKEDSSSTATRTSARQSTTSNSQAASISQPQQQQQQQPQQPQSQPQITTQADLNATRARTSFPSSAASTQSRNPGAPGAESTLGARLNHLMSLPHFANLQATLHHDPHLLSSAIESLSTADPEMYQFVSENPDLFINALNTTPAAGMASHRVSARQRRSESRGQALVSGAGGGGGSEQLGISHMLPSATDHDKQAIERLKELGFSELQAIQAYVACDKDEHLAANLLFSMDQ